MAESSLLSWCEVPVRLVSQWPFGPKSQRRSQRSTSRLAARGPDLYSAELPWLALRASTMQAMRPLEMDLDPASVSVSVFFLFGWGVGWGWGGGWGVGGESGKDSKAHIIVNPSADVKEITRASPVFCLSSSCVSPF